MSTDSRARSPTALHRFAREFAQWFEWARGLLTAQTDADHLPPRLEHLSRVAVWLVADYLLQGSDALPSVQRVLTGAALSAAAVETLPLGVVWPLPGQAHRCLWEIVSSYATRLDEAVDAVNHLTPAVFSAMFNTLLSAGSTADRLSLQKLRGSFDTPSCVATDMVLNALEPWLTAQVPALTAGRGLLRGTEPVAQPLALRSALVTAIAQLKAIDPACGAGIFPLRLAAELDRLLTQLDPEYRQMGVFSAPMLCSDRGEAAPAALGRRWSVLTHCIYGIDLQPLAVEITRIRCLFWLLASVDAPRDWVGPLWVAVRSDQMHLLATDALLVDAARHFDVAGFDLAIANPPYIDSEAMVKYHPALRKQYATLFESAKGNWDVFVLFVEWGLRSLTPTGVLSYIVPNKLLSAPYASSLRRLLQHYGVCHIHDFSNVTVFRAARVYPVVITAQRQWPKPPVRVTVMQSLTQPASCRVVATQQFYQDTDWSRHFAPAALQPLLDRCNAFAPMGQWFPAIAPAMTVREAYALQPLLWDGPSSRPHKKLVNTGTIDRYRLLWGDRPTRYLKQRYQRPIVHDQDLHQLNPVRLRQAATPKLIVGGMTRQLECCYDAGLCVAGKSTTIVLPGAFDLRYALALLNSSLMALWYCNTYGALALSGGYLRISHRELRTIPMPAPTALQQQQIVACVDQLMGADLLQSDAVEQELNRLIYRLYGLSSNDVDRVEAWLSSTRSDTPVVLHR